MTVLIRGSVTCDFDARGSKNIQILTRDKNVLLLNRTEASKMLFSIPNGKIPNSQMKIE